MQQTSQKCPRGDNNTSSSDCQSKIRLDANRNSTIDKNTGHIGLLYIEIICALQNRFYTKLVGLFVALHSWRSNRRAFGSVLYSKLYSCCIRIISYCITTMFYLAIYISLC